MRYISVLFFIGLCGLSASAQGRSSTVYFVPARSVALVRVDWTRVRNDEGLKRIINGDSFGSVAAQMGLAADSVTEWTVFSDINPTSSRGLGMIVSGRFTSASIIQFARSQGWSSTKIGSLTAFINPSDNSYLMPVRNGIVASGTKAAIEKVQHVVSKKMAALVTQQPFSPIWGRLGSAGDPISLMIGVPAEYQTVAGIAYKVAAKLMNLASFGIMGTIMEQVGLVRSMGMNVRRDAGGYPTQLFAMMDSETKAWLAAGALNLLKKAPAAIGAKPQTAAEQRAFNGLQSMTASYKRDILSVKFTMPESAMPK